MELFLPSAVVLLLSILIFMYVMPRLSPYILGVSSIILFSVGLIQHYSTFSYEYGKLWPIVMEYSPFLVLILLISGLMFTYGSNKSSNVGYTNANKNAGILASLPAMPAMPAIPAIPSVAEMPSSIVASVKSVFGNSPVKTNTVRANNVRSNTASLASNSFKSV